MDFKERIYQARKAKGFSQEDLAEKLGVTRQSISLWENNQTQPSIDNIIAIAKVFGLSTDDLLLSATEEQEENIEENLNDSITKNEKSKNKLSKKNKILFLRSTPSSRFVNLILAGITPLGSHWIGCCPL